MVLLTSHMFKIIRSIDPEAVIISPSGEAPYMDKFYAAGSKNGDVSLHGYPDPKNAVPETIGGFLSVPMKAVMAKYGLSQKPLWDTEGSWGDTNSSAITDPDLQAAFVARDYLLLVKRHPPLLLVYMGESWGGLCDRVKVTHATAIAKPVLLEHPM